MRGENRCVSRNPECRLYSRFIGLIVPGACSAFSWFENEWSIFVGISFTRLTSLPIWATYPERSSRVSRANSPLLYLVARIVACRERAGASRVRGTFLNPSLADRIEFRHENHRGLIVYPITETLLCGISRVWASDRMVLIRHSLWHRARAVDPQEYFVPCRSHIPPLARLLRTSSLLRSSVWSMRLDFYES